ncbi:hypothetical protein L6452_02579 [Arctium lappa]|uniref:Uncharacterized protein n=1 Tax=Arctium lappa TaxID=4217 RepID=A0ACB9FKT4_ARCLA|nr:hypothetical protein L6452_02579 [Arctium lappa]
MIAPHSILPHLEESEIFSVEVDLLEWKQNWVVMVGSSGTDHGGDGDGDGEEPNLGGDAHLEESKMFSAEVDLLEWKQILVVMVGSSGTDHGRDADGEETDLGGDAPEVMVGSSESK